VSVTVDLSQEVAENPEYVSCAEGAFDEYDFVFCRRKTDQQNNTCAFLARSVVGEQPEENL
jgi:hypothetical protein